MMKTKYLKQKKGQFPHGLAGMTLVEVVVALAITGLAVGAIVNGYIYCTNAAQKSALSLAANARAMERIEETRSAKWDTVSWPTIDQLVGPNFPNKTNILDMAGSTTNNAVMAVIRTEITQILGPSNAPPLKQIRVDCVWRYRNQTFTNTIVTCRSPDQ
jgi:type II secretory pathway pseudopilin PulG